MIQVKEFITFSDRSQMEEANAFLEKIKGAKIIDVKYSIAWQPTEEKAGWPGSTVSGVLIVYEVK
jgi:hypothetical protein